MNDYGSKLTLLFTSQIHEKLTPIFRRISLTKLSAECLADGVIGVDPLRVGSVKKNKSQILEINLISDYFGAWTDYLI